MKWAEGNAKVRRGPVHNIEEACSLACPPVQDGVSRRGHSPGGSAAG